MQIECHNLGDNIEIVFADNGKGVDMKKNGADLFGLYKRFDTTVKGKGLGLYLVKMQVESLGGKITAQGEVDKGMQFTILLPKN
jgi:signal transduction histidine kinase